MDNIVVKAPIKQIEVERPTLKRIVEWLLPLPEYSVLFGMAEDGLPILLDAKDTLSPNVIVWDKLARQSLHILKVISEYLFQHRSQNTEIEFIVLTLYPEDWGELNKYGMGAQGKTSCIGIIPFGSKLAEKVMEGLAKWVNEKHKSSKQPVIVLVDGLENVNRMSKDFQDHFRYLLDLGRKKNVYIIGTSHKSHFFQVYKWLDGFQREIYGRQIDYEFEWIDRNNTVLFYTPRTELI